MRTRALDHRSARLDDRPLDEGDIDDDTEIVGIIDTCKLCFRTFTAKQLDEVFCPECEKKADDRKEKFHKDNQLGLGERMGARAMVPRKIGGTWSGGGIEKHGRQALDNYRTTEKTINLDPEDILGQKVNGRQVA